LTKFVLCIAMVLTLIAAAGAESPRVFITDSNSWEMSGSSGGANGAFGAQVHGGARPQTAEIIKTFGERCPGVIVNNKQEKSDYVVLLDHEGGKGLIRKDNKVAVFNVEGDSILSHSTRSLGSSVQDACGAITKDWEANGSKPKPKGPAQNAVAPAKAPEFSGKVNISSQPLGADIEVDGSFVGSTPSTINLTPGEHVIAVKKNGYKDWEKKLKFAGGEINLSPELEKVQ
jgi:hypothetical protein